ncbi:hypothetical protein RUM44_011006 [Polyplax serrata]|uniref:Uncharacterized protein n=1 Tax=Polyplax serrata TaxID=468196 RepID=A0ABR1AQJ4_POLSC
MNRLGARDASTPSGDQVDGKLPSDGDKIPPPAGSISTYAGIVKGPTHGPMSGTGFREVNVEDSDKLREIAAASESPPKEGFRFDDDNEFPPVTQKTE